MTKKKKTAVGARLLADDNVKNEKARGLASYEGPNAFRPCSAQLKAKATTVLRV